MFLILSRFFCTIFNLIMLQFTHILKGANYMAEFKDINGHLHDDKDMLKSGAMALRGSYICAYCKEIHKVTISEGTLGRCPKCGYDRWIK